MVRKGVLREPFLLRTPTPLLPGAPPPTSGPRTTAQWKSSCFPCGRPHPCCFRCGCSKEVSPPPSLLKVDIPEGTGLSPYLWGFESLITPTKASGQIVNAFERAVILRLGHLRKGEAEGPGLYFVLPCTDTVITVDMRTKAFCIPLQEILTKDPVSVDVDGVIYYRVQDAFLAVTNVTDPDAATLFLAATTLRNVLGTNNVSQIITNREKIAQNIQSILDNSTGAWGITVQHVEIRNVKTTVKLVAEETTGKPPPKIVKEASIVISESPVSLQFRCTQKTEDTNTYHQTSTVIFTYP